MITFKIRFCAVLAAAAFMMLSGAAKAAPSVEELCNWGEWSAVQGIELKELVKTLNEIDGMPNDDKLILIKCYVEANGTK